MKDVFFVSVTVNCPYNLLSIRNYQKLEVKSLSNFYTLPIPEY